MDITSIMWRPASYSANVYKRLELRRHITFDATLRILCAAAHKMRQYRTSGTVQGAPGNRRSYCETPIAPVQSLKSKVCLRGHSCRSGFLAERQEWVGFALSLIAYISHDCRTGMGR